MIAARPNLIVIPVASGHHTDGRDQKQVEWSTFFGQTESYYRIPWTLMCVILSLELIETGGCANLPDVKSMIENQITAFQNKR